MELSDLQGWWALLAAVMSGVSGWGLTFWNYRQSKRKLEREIEEDKKKSDEQMLAALETFKEKLVLNVVQQVETAEKNAETTIILNFISKFCPDCYTKALKALNDQNSG